jgi:hypothetical protein
MKSIIQEFNDAASNMGPFSTDRAVTGLFLMNSD